MSCWQPLVVVGRPRQTWGQRTGEQKKTWEMLGVPAFVGFIGVKCQRRRFHIFGMFDLKIYNKLKSIPASTGMNWIQRKQVGRMTYILLISLSEYRSQHVSMCNIIRNSDQDKVSTCHDVQLSMVSFSCPVFLISPVFTTETQIILRLNMVWTYFPTVNQSYLDQAPCFWATLAAAASTPPRSLLVRSSVPLP